MCLATFNGARFITRQLNSILGQLHSDDEVIVVDDASTDETLAMIGTIADRRVRVIVRPQNGGVVAAFEDAFHHAAGDVIFLSDQDDVWLPGKVNAVLERLALGYDLVVHDAVIVNDGKVLGDSLYVSRRSGPGVLHNLVRNSYVGCCMAFRRTVLSDVLPVPRTRRILHDAWIGVAAELRGWRIDFLRRPLIEYVLHDSNVSSRLPLGTALVNRAVLAYAACRFLLRRRRSARAHPS